MTHESQAWLDRPAASFLPGLSRETGLILLILALALYSRLSGVGDRVMSFDEINHVVPSYEFAQGRGYRYDPMTHGPLQFHLIGLSFFIFGDNDASARYPAALFGAGTILFVALAYRRFLGRMGALAAGFGLLISPYMLFYGRYARNEIFIALWAAAMLYAVLAYLESGATKYLFLFTLANALHFVDKTTAYIFAGEIGLFLALHFIHSVLRQRWQNPGYRRGFVLALVLLAVFAGAALGVFLTKLTPATRIVLLASLPGAALAFAAAAYSLVKGCGLDRLRGERSFDLLLLEVTLVLPCSAAIFIQAAGLDPLNTAPSGWLVSGLFILPLAVLAAVLGLWWRKKTWLVCMAIFWSIFTLFYSTLFTNPQGIPMGLVTALGYWITQQEVQRGSQPLYYYLLVQLPMYEFLPVAGALTAIGIGLRHRLWAALPGLPFRRPEEVPPDAEEPQEAPGESPAAAPEAPGPRPVPTLALLVFWSLSNLIIFSLAGERMPWLTVNIALPLILAAGWGIGYLAETTRWQQIRLLDGAGLRRAAAGLGFALLAVLTLRTAIRAAFINYDTALEFLVYAHSAPGAKEALAQIAEISTLTTGGKDIAVAYDMDVNYPYWWYLRDYPKKVYYGDQPTRELRNYPLVAVGEAQFGKVDPILGKDYYKYETIRLWWPMEDYANLTWERIRAALLDPAMRNALFQIWFNRNYQPYAGLEKRDNLSLTHWQPSQRMRLYVRKDVAAQMWGMEAAGAQTLTVDPYAAGKIALSAGLSAGSPGAAPGQLNAPRQVAFAADGSLYVADSRNNRIQHLSADGGTVIAQWGTFADVSQGSAPGGAFFEPWGVTVGPDGSVYVADTWNNRVQKFSADGSFLAMWGVLGEGNQPDAFWGPRGLAVDRRGRLYVADTGNKRIVVFDGDGKYITQFGGAGAEAGQFDEPVGVAIDGDGRVYISDTWNRRVQVMAPDPEGVVFTPVSAWEIDGWFGQSLENKPFIAVDGRGRVFVTDPEGCRVLEFNASGDFAHTWDLPGAGAAAGIAADALGNVWVSDATNMRLLRFAPPQ